MRREALAAVLLILAVPAEARDPEMRMVVHGEQVIVGELVAEDSLSITLGFGHVIGGELDGIPVGHRWSCTHRVDKLLCDRIERLAVVRPAGEHFDLEAFERDLRKLLSWRKIDPDGDWLFMPSPGFDPHEFDVWRKTCNEDSSLAD